MALQPMYPGKVNSPQTELASAIDDEQTTIPLLDASVLPDPPNICTIGTGEDAETILYTGVSGNDLTGVTRGFQGVAKAWSVGAKVARYFTAYDHDAFIENINSHASRHLEGGADPIPYATETTGGLMSAEDKQSLVELEGLPNEVTAFKADLAKVGLDYSGDTANPRGENAVDLQHVRVSPDQVAGAPNSFIAGGARNKIQRVVERDSDPSSAHVEGFGNWAIEWFAHAEGANCIADGKISHAEGNAVVCTANDAHAEGNRTVAGRKLFMGVSTGSEDAGDGLGVLQYVLIPEDEGDVTSWFPNPLTDNITVRYGAGAQKDVKGNIYPNNTTPAIWTGDVPTTPNDLRWAMHSICILRGSSEGALAFARIAKATFTPGVGTKVYYYGPMPFSSLTAIYSSYAPQVYVYGDANHLGVGLQGGNGSHAEGFMTSAYGYGTHAEGFMTRAWGHSAHAQGRETRAYGHYSHAEGLYSEARGIASRATGQDSLAIRDYQHAHAVGKISKKGDCQRTVIDYKQGPLTGVGWFEIFILKGIEVGKAYHFETMVLGRQVAGTAGNIGDTFMYKCSGGFVRNSDGSYTVLGTFECKLIGRSPGMDGDGINTGVRLSPATSFTNNNIFYRMDGLADTSWVVQTHNVIQEMAV